MQQKCNSVCSSLPKMLLFILISCLVVSSQQLAQKPNIVIIVADDLGWNDVGFHGSNQIPTPNIDALAYSGVILNNYYVMPVCTPSRAALMTGRHPIHTGTWNHVILSNEPWGLGLEEKLLPEFLKEQDYVTRIVGKWHLGFFQKEYTPTFRGFDSHYGFWCGHLDYYTHNAYQDIGYDGYDWRRNIEVSWEAFEEYSTSEFTREAVSVIADHNVSQPLFLYLPHHAVHTSTIEEHQLQAPQEVIDQFQDIEDPERRTFAAMVTMLDRSVGEVTSALGSRGMLENSIIIFTTDNGGAAGGFKDNVASNWPLRGTKDTGWEGGVRGAGFIWSPLLSNTPRVSTQLTHVQDWLPTLMAALNASEALEGIALDGREVWGALGDPDTPTYDELLLQLDVTEGKKFAAIKQGKWKLLQGTTYDGEYDGVFEPSGRGGEYDLAAVQQSEAAIAIDATSRPLPTSDVILALRTQAEITCQNGLLSSCRPLSGAACLFDLEADPCEVVDLSRSEPLVLAALQEALERHNATRVPDRNQPLDPASSPIYWNNTWVPWRDPLMSKTPAK